MRKFVIKKQNQLRKPIQHSIVTGVENAEKPISILEVSKENKKEEKKDTVMMDTKDKVAIASSILEAGQNLNKAKRIKKDKGLIERVESSTIVLTEDNKELLKD